MSSLVPRSAFHGLIEGMDAGAGGVWLRPMPTASATSVLARRGAGTAVAERIRALCGLDTPAGPRRVAGADIAFTGVGPGAWLAVAPHDIDAAWPARLGAALAGVASVVDQSGGRAIARLGGPRAADLLAKGCFVDLHPSVFPPGAAASTLLAQVSVTLARIDAAEFELAIPRSFTAAFAHWLGVAAAEYGLSLQPDQAS